MDSKVLQQIEDVLALLRATSTELAKDCFDTVVPESLLDAAKAKLVRLIDAEVRDTEFEEDLPF